MDDLSARREKAQTTLLDLFATTTGVPIGMYEYRDGSMQSFVSEASLANFEPHCRLIQSLPNGKRLCEADQCNRAVGAIGTGKAQLSVCYAGVWNQVVPIKLRNEFRGALLYGEMQIDTSEHRRISLEKHEEAVQRLALNTTQAAELRKALLTTRTCTTEELEKYKDLLRTFQEWFYALVEEEERVKLAVERVTHEIQTRLQAVIADSEMLASEVSQVDSALAKEMASHVLNSALALDTVIQSLGQYMEEYRFRLSPIKPILCEAKRVYEREASRKGVEIVLDVQADVHADISKHHFQHAINNMVQNAVKYSFAARSNRRRYVEVVCRSDERTVSISISNYGVGILAEEIDSRAIFRLDYQGRLTEGEFRTGSGKGLYFADRVIEGHGGRIEVASTKVAPAVASERMPHLNRFTIHVPVRQQRGLY
jgi:signal transduction histidine kinase